MYSTRVWHNCLQTTDAPEVSISVDVRVYHKSVAYFNYVLLIVVVVHRGSEIVVIIAGTHGRMTVVIIELHGYISTVRRVMVKCSALTGSFRICTVRGSEARMHPRHGRRSVSWNNLMRGI